MLYKRAVILAYNRANYKNYRFVYNFINIILFPENCKCHVK